MRPIALLLIIFLSSCNEKKTENNTNRFKIVNTKFNATYLLDSQTGRVWRIKAGPISNDVLEEVNSIDYSK